MKKLIEILYRTKDCSDMVQMKKLIRNKIFFSTLWFTTIFFSFIIQIIIVIIIILNSLEKSDESRNIQLAW